MKNRTLRVLIVVGSFTILTNLGIQLYLLHQAFNEGQKKFSQTVHVALLEVLSKMYDNIPRELPQPSPVKKISNDYYIVDVNDRINAEVLEFYLRTELNHFGINADFEYGIYDCETDQMVYGDYVSMSSDSEKNEPSGYLPKHPDLVYYFAIRFPQQKQYLVGTLKIWITLTVISVSILLFFVYVILAVLRQKKLSELQREFINNMTHEFKTPLTSNRIAIEFLQNHNLINSDPRLMKYVNLIGMQNDHLNSQVERILQTSLMEKRNFPIDTREIDLTSILERVVGSFQISDERIYKVGLPESPVLVQADEIHLTNMLYSIIDNARKYSPPETDIHVTLDLTEKNYLMKVRDEGIGISQDQLKRIFKKFYRIPQGDVHNVKGFGIGLYYVDKVVRRFGWRIEIESQPGSGTTVQLIIPRKK